MGVLDTNNTSQRAAASETIDDDAELEDIDAHDHDAEIQEGIEYASNRASPSKSWYGVSSRATDDSTRTTQKPHSATAHDTPPASLAFGPTSSLSSFDISPLNSSDVSFELFEAPPGCKGEVDNIATELCGSPRRKKAHNNDKGHGNRKGPFQRLLEDEPNYPRSLCANRCDKGKEGAVQLQIDICAESWMN